jgi:lambda family phage portal protein
MPILDLGGAKRLEGYAPRRRTLSEASLPAGYGGYGAGSMVQAGGFAAAKINRLSADFLGSSRSADMDLFGDNRRLRARARTLAVDNPFGKKFLQMCSQNIVGASGILVKSKVKNQYGKETADTERINDRIDEEWQRWCKQGSCTADGKFSFVAAQHLAIKNIAREGENLVRIVYDRSFNPSSVALQTIDNDQLDDTLISQLTNGNEVRMGVEVNKYGRPLAYHVWDRHPNDIRGGGKRVRIDASEIIHSAVWERPGQTRGYTWMSAAILELNQYNRFEEATIVASRASAAKFATIEQELGDDWNADADDEGEEGIDSTGNTGVQPGVSGNAGEMLMLDPGQKLNYVDPKFPTANFAPFTKQILRNVASGLLVMYPSLANDLEGVNFSSIRAGMVDERDMWRILQRWFMDSYIVPVRMAWLRMALLTTLSDITLSDKQLDQFLMRARGWDWVDPSKDMQSIILKLGEGISTLEDECAKVGLDWQEVVDQRAREQEYIKSKNIVFGVDITGDQAGKGVAAGDESEAAQVEGSKSGEDDQQSSQQSYKQGSGKKGAAKQKA